MHYKHQARIELVSTSNCLTPWYCQKLQTSQPHHDFNSHSLSWETPDLITVGIKLDTTEIRYSLWECRGISTTKNYKVARQWAVITLWESRTKCQTIITFFITKSGHKLPWLLHNWFHQLLTVAVILGKQFPQHLPKYCQQSWVCLVSGSDRKTTVATITDERRHPREHNPQRLGETERESMQIDTKLQASP